MQKPTAKTGSTVIRTDPVPDVKKIDWENMQVMDHESDRTGLQSMTTTMYEEAYSKNRIHSHSNESGF